MPEQHKRCQFCGEEILSVAIKCKHCGSDLTQPQMSGAGAGEAQAVERNWNILLWLLLVGSISVAVILLLSNPGSVAVRLGVSVLYGLRPDLLSCLDAQLLTYCTYNRAGFLGMFGSIYNNYFVFYVAVLTPVLLLTVSYFCVKALFLTTAQKERWSRAEGKVDKYMRYFQWGMAAVVILGCAGFLVYNAMFR